MTQRAIGVVEFGLFQTQIPLRKEIRHASFARSDSENIIVRAVLENGVEGFGEGLPRPYVTGEDITQAMDLLRRGNLLGQLYAVSDYASAARMANALKLETLEPDARNCFGNSALCAVELALLDAYGKQFRQPVSALPRLMPEFQHLAQSLSRVRYSGAITMGSERQEFWSAFKTRVYGFRDCKIKVGEDGDADFERLRLMRRRLGRRMRIRIDANEAWPVEEVAERIRRLAVFDITSVEQPVPHEHVLGLSQVRREALVPIMHDESICSMVDAQNAVEQSTCDLFNIRLSKCGGFVKSLQIAAFAQSHGIGYQLGCQVGETGILSAAGRHFATSVRGIRFLEGSYDRHLVAEPLTCEDLTFGFGGRAPALRKPGLSITVDKQALSRVTCREERICLG